MGQRMPQNISVLIDMTSVRHTVTSVRENSESLNVHSDAEQKQTLIRFYSHSWLITLSFSDLFIWIVMFFRSSHPQTWRRGAGETNRPHGEDRRGHRWHPPLRHHFLRSGAPHEEKVSFPFLLVEILLQICGRGWNLTFRVLTNK